MEGTEPETIGEDEIRGVALPVAAVAKEWGIFHVLGSHRWAFLIGVLLAAAVGLVAIDPEPLWRGMLISLIAFGIPMGVGISRLAYGMERHAKQTS